MSAIGQATTQLAMTDLTELTETLAEVAAGAEAPSRELAQRAAIYAVLERERHAAHTADMAAITQAQATTEARNAAREECQRTHWQETWAMSAYHAACRADEAAERAAVRAHGYYDGVLALEAALHEVLDVDVARHVADDATLAERREGAA